MSEDKQPELTPEQKQWQDHVAHAVRLGGCFLNIAAITNQPPHIAVIAGQKVLKEGLAAMHQSDPKAAAEMVRMIADDFLRACQQIGIEVAQSEAAE